MQIQEEMNIVQEESAMEKIIEGGLKVNSRMRSP